MRTSRSVARTANTGFCSRAPSRRGECRAKEQRVELAMFLDGNELKTVSDPNRPRPFEAFALIAFASEAGTDVRYDNFVAEEIGQDDSN